MPAAVLTAAEIENIRFHLGYGNLGVGSYPWTPDGFFELFTNVIALYLSTGAETSATTAIGASGGPLIVTVTPLDMTGIAPNVRLLVDCDDDMESVVVKSTTLTTFTARFSKSHDASGYPVAVETGVARLRYLLHRAGRLHEQMFGPLVSATAGIQSVDKGEVVWFGRSSVLKSLYDQYAAIVAQICSLIRVDPVQVGSGPATALEAY